MSEYRVALDVYNGPLDLLLFLIRREEVDIYDIPIARITGQYVQYVDMLQQLDPEVAGEFLVLAATLMEIKSRTLLPRPPVDQDDDEIVDPRLELVRQLLEYKKYKDAARSLEEAAGERALKHPRRPVLPPRDPKELELENLEIWDLFDAFNRLLEQIGTKQQVHEVTVDDTPLALHADDMVDSLEREGGTQTFEDVFAGRTRAEMIGLFLALLELIRRRRVRASQDHPFGPILIHLLDPACEDEVDEEDYETEAHETPGRGVFQQPVYAEPGAESDERAGVDAGTDGVLAEASPDPPDQIPSHVTGEASYEETIASEPFHETQRTTRGARDGVAEGCRPRGQLRTRHAQRTSRAHQRPAPRQRWTSALYGQIGIGRERRGGRRGRGGRGAERAGGGGQRRGRT